MTTRTLTYTQQPTIILATITNPEMQTDSTVPQVFASTRPQITVTPTVTIKAEAQDFLDSQTEQTDLETFFGINQAVDFTTRLPFNTSLALSQNRPVKSEPLEFVDPIPTTVTTMTTHTLTSTRQPTTILATTNTLETQTETNVPQVITTTVTQPTATQNVAIKTEPREFPDSKMEQTVTTDPVIIPPTPPNSASSDSEGGLSPQRSAPSSPVSRNSLWKPYKQPFYKKPITLILSEEEKRALVTDGYPIPIELPLTKQEERCLMKIRRKIKNKISAQESRRKKKEYLEALEKRVETFWQENNELKKKVDFLKATNRTLNGQLQIFQSLSGTISLPGTGGSQ